MADATELTQLAVSKIGTPANPIITLVSGVTSTDTTLIFSSPVEDSAGATFTDSMLLAIEDVDSRFKEVINIEPGAWNSDNTRAIGTASVGSRVIRGIDPDGIDFTTTNTAFATSLGAGSVCGIPVSAQQMQMVLDVLLGTLPTGGENFRIGADADNNITIFAHNGDTNEPFLRYDSATSTWIFSNDGVSSGDVGGGTGSVTGGDGIDVTAGVVSVDLDTDPGLEINSATLRAKVLASGGVTRDSDGLSIDQSNVKIQEDVAVTATSTEINQALDGISANVTDTNLNTLTAGASSDADPLHTHDGLAIVAGNGDGSRSASGVQNIAHGLGKAPKRIMFYGITTPNFSTLGNGLEGVWSDTAVRSIVDNLATPTLTLETTFVMVGNDGAANNRDLEATCTVDATNIILTWTDPSGSFSGTVTFLWEAIA